ncbi:MAG: type II toxin-antitoxin system VapC family toxin [Betaproteobacteria bacterium]|nr:type II toxin-antitoxin system VapC family toxin [Betaproteobacteria bacterium]
MVVVDTHVLIHDALEPKKISRRARAALDGGHGPLAISDISLWEIAMLIAKGRIDPAADGARFLEKILEARAIRVLPITPQIAVLSQSGDFPHRDPADRIIAATAVVYRARLVTSDAALRRSRGLEVIW